jgi:hypothetical protein
VGFEVKIEQVEVKSSLVLIVLAEKNVIRPERSTAQSKDTK